MRTVAIPEIPVIKQDRKIVFARLKAFHRYLSEITSDDNQLQLIADNKMVFSHVINRYELLLDDLGGIREFDDMISPQYTTDVPYLLHLASEIKYACDIADALDLKDQENSETPRFSPSENTPFSTDEIEKITRTLDDLRDRLLIHVDQAQPSVLTGGQVKQIVSAEIEALKSQATKIGRKDWKVLLVSFAMSLVLYLGFTEAGRKEVYTAFEVLSYVCYQVEVPSEVPPPPLGSLAP
jgi:hypothetical protein